MSSREARWWRGLRDGRPWWVRWIAVNVELLVFQNLVFTLVRGVEGTTEWLTFTARATAFVLIAAYVASFARKPGWLPVREE